MKKLIRSIQGKITAFIIGVTLTLGSCQNVYKSEDFTGENVFTAGIEGPAVDAAGYIYAVNFAEEGTIGRVDSLGNASLFARLPGSSVGNGIRFDSQGNMYIADYVNHNVLRIKSGEREAEVYAHHEELNQPNDLAIAPDGTLYASDPNWKDGTGKLWKVNADGFHLLEEGMGTTNGIEVSPDGALLYVNESVQRRIWVYDLGPDGIPVNKRLFHTFSDHGLDGMRCDSAGNLYVCRYDAGKVLVIDPGGNILREVHLKGRKPSNIAFGGAGRKRCFVTMADRGCLETFEALNPGRGL